MPTVVLEPKPGDPSPAIEAAVPEGGALVDVCDDLRAPIPFSCKSANCGTCRVDILEGGDELLPPKDDELDLLDIFGAGAGSGVRLACQVKMKPGLARLRVRPVDEGR